MQRPHAAIAREGEMRNLPKRILQGFRRTFPGAFRRGERSSASIRLTLQKFHPSGGSCFRLDPSAVNLRCPMDTAERVLSTIRCARALKDSGTDCSLTIAGRLGWPGGPADIRREIARVDLENAVTVLPSFTQDEAS